MRANLNTIFGRYKEIAKLTWITSISQLIVQAVGLFCGIMVIRVLPQDEYALYTLANTMLGTMVILANGGISTGVMSEGGKVWTDKKKLGQVLNSGIDLRNKFGLISLLVCIPILSYLLIKNNADVLTIFLITICLIPAYFSSLSEVILEIPPKLKQDIISLQKNQLFVNFGRLILLGLTIFIFPFAYIAIAAAGIPRVWGNYKLRKIASKHVDLKEKGNNETRKNILSTVKRVLPEAIYYCISGQITIWLLAVFGSTASIAEIGALGRIAMLLNIIAIVLKTLLAPRFARLQNNYKLLLKRYIQIQLLTLSIFASVIFFSSFFKSQILWILGNQYLELETELILAMIGSSLVIFSGVIYTFYSYRGWIMHPLLSIIISITTLIITIWLTDITTLKGVLFLNITIGIVQLLTNSLYGFFRIFQLKFDNKNYNKGQSNF
ncbi:MATE family efflux transporter [Maribacter dokdonensis]|uniref:polysaccharide biosynthesis protein n=1 Tax=Maribacter dokdonensis TaxID=320912 RepID=UPI002AAF5186|nr:polysaccharide biosynthesis protein [Maribacter dokdonensis]